MIDHAHRDGLDALRLSVGNGAGLVHRSPGKVLVIPDRQPGGNAATLRLLDYCRHTHDPTGRRIVRQVAALLAECEPSEVPSFCLLISSGDGVVMMAHGDVEVETNGDVSERVNGASSLAWVERRIVGPIRTIAITQTGGTVTTAADDAVFDLQLGTVPGGLAVLRGHEAPDAHGMPDASASAAPASRAHTVITDTGSLRRPADPAVATPSEPSEKPLQSHDAESVQLEDTQEHQLAPATAEHVIAPLGAADHELPAAKPSEHEHFKNMLLTDPEPSASEGREPLPVMSDAEEHQPELPDTGDAPPLLVEGALCSRGHFNDPDSPYCSVCGISMLQRTRNTVIRPRPPLGVLVVDDGSAYTVTSPYVLGREPHVDEDVAKGEARALVLDDETHSVSRVHASFSLDGWDVLLTDRGSSNGTYVSSSGATGPWEALSPHIATRLDSRTHIRVGRRQLVFDSFHAGAGAA